MWVPNLFFVFVVAFLAVITLASLLTTTSRISRFHVVTPKLDPPLLSSISNQASTTTTTTTTTTTFSCPPSSLFAGINKHVPSMPKGKLVFDATYLSKLKALPDIPKILHLAWNDRKALQSNTPLAKQGIRRMIALNPDWELHFLEDPEMDAYIQKHLSAEDWELLRLQHIVERADVWRLLVVIHEGGFYQDMDRVYSRPLKDILKPETKMLLPVNCGVNFAQDLMCSAPCNEIHLAALQLNLERRRALHEKHSKKNQKGKDQQGGAAAGEPEVIRRYNRTRADILSMGPVAYFNAATFVLFGEMLKYDKDTVDSIFTLLSGLSPLVETYCEKRCNTITHPWDSACWNVTRDQLHQEKKQKKWLDEI